ncbi:MAG TPA: hypothetical protein VD930_12715 [Gemmatimonadales bacterium]|nr:hypothetical protein [Gemmatimonadales bacterium]
MRARASRRALSAGSCDKKGLTGRVPAGAGAGALDGLAGGRDTGTAGGVPLGDAGLGAAAAGAAGLGGPEGDAGGTVVGRATGVAPAGLTGLWGDPGLGADGGTAAAGLWTPLGATRGGSGRGGSARGGSIRRGDNGDGSGRAGSGRGGSARGGSARGGSARSAGDSRFGSIRGAWETSDSGLLAAGCIGAATGAASPSRRTAKTALHTLQRARTPPWGTLAGSTR